MTVLNLLGWSVLLVPLVVILTMVAVEYGMREVFVIVGIVVAIVTFIFTGMSLVML